MKKNLLCKPQAASICLAAAILAGCADSKPQPPNDRYFSAIVTASQGSPGGSFTWGIGVVMIERATGDVYF